MAYHLSTGWGDQVENPSLEQLAQILASPWITDLEHGEAWLTHESEWSLSFNGRDRVTWREPWQPGYGSEPLSDEQRAEIEAAVRERDRRFYDSLGAERADTPCREPGCTRGAVAASVLCRVHHFEAVRHKACPFRD